MAKLDKNMIKYLTRLSRIRCTEEEEEGLLRDLKKVLDYIDLLEGINTENVPTCTHVLEEMENVMREDIVGKTLSRETFLANAPSHTGGMIRVPPVLKN